MNCIDRLMYMYIDKNKTESFFYVQTWKHESSKNKKLEESSEL